jgi:hypothetical protein
MAANRSGAGRELRGVIAMVVFAVLLIIAAKTGLLTALSTWLGNFLSDHWFSGLTDAAATP